MAHTYTANSSHVYFETVDTKTIRLLRFSRKQDGSFTGKFKKFSLANAPDYYTASYTWGQQTYSNTIHIDSGNSIPILSSLSPFLKMISFHRDFNDQDWWWFDSICIDQRNKQEKSEQIKIMGEIYKRAKRCIVWLGEEVEQGSDCRVAIDFLHTLFAAKDFLEAATPAEMARNQYRDEAYTVYWQSVGALLGRSWWLRVWTLQEFLLPPEVKFYCGMNNISRKKLNTALFSISVIRNHFDIPIPHLAFDTAWNRRRILQWYKEFGSMTLLATIAYAGNNIASNPRDRIYSILGLVSGKERRLVGDPDYTLQVERTYAQLVQSYWNEYKRLDIICFSHLFNFEAVPDNGMEPISKTLPSWAPDWRAFIQPAPVPLMVSQSSSAHVGNFRPLHSQKSKAVYDATGPRLAKHIRVRFAENLKEMWVDGVVLDVIDGLSSLDGCQSRCVSSVCQNINCHAGIPSRYQDNGRRVWPRRETLRAIVRSLVLDRNEKYLRFSSPEEYVSELERLAVAWQGREQVDALLQTWLDNNRWFRIRGQDLGSILLDPSSSSGVRTPAGQSPLSKDTEPFIARFQDTVSKKSRKLMVTTEGYIGMAPCAARQGDVVTVLLGCSIPLVLRQVGSREAWKVIGEAYVDEYMNGEISTSVERGKRAIKRFRLV